MRNSKKTILVIDDQRDIHLLLKAVLEHAGYRVASALDAAQGGMMARQLKPDLVILDITMPAGGGYLTYDRLRKTSNFATMPILLYTAVPREEVESKIAKNGDTLMLAKPAAPGHIVSAVESLLDVH